MSGLEALSSSLSYKLAATDYVNSGKFSLDRDQPGYVTTVPG